MAPLLRHGTSARVLIAGGGVAALEAALALRTLVEERVTIELLGPEPHFWYRPLAVAEPFQLGKAHRYELSALAAAAGATFTLGSLQGVDARRHCAITSVGELSYDVLLVAVGAVPTVGVPGAFTFRGPADSEGVRVLLDELLTGVVRRVAFVAPPGAIWSLPLYELALMTAAHLEKHGVDGVELVLVTPEYEPLQLFGRAASDAVGELLSAQGIELVAGVTPTEVVDGGLRLLPAGHVGADRFVALPRLRGARLDGLPQTLDGFLVVDEHGRIQGLADVYAAGDITSFPVKQGGIAAQQADAAAEMIAAQFDETISPKSFAPVLRGLLLTGGEPRYLRHHLIGGLGRSDVVSPEPLWWPPAKIVGRHLAPFLAAYTGSGVPVEDAPVPGSIPIEIELTQPTLEQLAPSPVELSVTDGETVGDVMAAGVLVVAPEDTLGEVAERLCELELGSAAVADYGRLIGILTSRDLLRAFAGRVHSSEARVRQWMTAEPIAVQADAPIEAAVALMREHGIHHLPVVEGERPIGMLGFREAARRVRGPGIGLGF